MADIPQPLVAIFEAKKAAMAARPQEEQDKIKAVMMEIFMDADKKAEMMAMQEATFKAADTNEDGELDLAEYVNYTNMTGKNFSAKMGTPLGSDKTAEELSAHWEAHKVSGKAGVTHADTVQVMDWNMQWATANMM